MILHKLAKSLRGQDWFTVVLEIVIVVVGIFLGLQADDWNQARTDRAVETRYLERLQTDLLNDLRRLDRSSELAAERMAQVELLLNGIANPEVAANQPNRFIAAVEKAAWASYRPITPNAYAELLGTGKMALIRSESLREALAEYYTRIDYWENVMERASVEHEYSLATAGVISIDQMAAIERSGPQPGLADLGAKSRDAASIAEQLESRTQGVRLLPLVYKSHSLVTIVIAEHRERNEALQIAINAYLEGATDEP